LISNQHGEVVSLCGQDDGHAPLQVIRNAQLTCPARVSYQFPETNTAGRVRCSGWLGRGPLGIGLPRPELGHAYEAE
jgi:hypothetical protein